MTDRTELERQIAELQAQLAALDAEPDWEAWRPAASAFLRSFYGHDDMAKTVVRDTVQALIAALPLAPLARAPMGEGPWEQGVSYDGRAYLQGPFDHDARLYLDGDFRNAEQRDAYLAAIAQKLNASTLARVPAAAWPGEAVALRDKLTAQGFSHEDIIDQLGCWTFDTIRFLADGSKPEPQWIDWHGGECPVPAGTRVRVQFRHGDTSGDIAGNYDWSHEQMLHDIIAYRILGEQP